MTIKSSKTLVEDALKQIKTLEPHEAKELYDKNSCNLIDLRDIRELHNEGYIKNSVHIPRGMLEFWLDPESIYFKEGKVDVEKPIVLFCAAGARSALATKTLQDMGFKNVSHIKGGFNAMAEIGFDVLEKEKK